jgi:ParB family transcriptional regulator, chromosome partitioning protein
VVVNTPSRKERAAAVADGLFAPLAKRELLAGLGEVVNKKVPLTSIEANPRQPRQGVDETSPEFQDLVGSIRQQGLIQPISLWQLDEDQERYLVIAGERRWRAFKRLAEENPADYSRIPATVTVLDGDQPEARALMMGLIENVVREDLKDGERADALARLKESTGWTYEQIAQRMGMGVSRVVALASIARHESVRTAVDAGRLTQKQAIVIGQGVRDAELAAELVGAVLGLDDVETRTVVRQARALDSDTPAAERVASARRAVRGYPVALPEHLKQWEETSAKSRASSSDPTAAADVVQLRLTPLFALVGQDEVSRAELTAVLQAACEMLDFWPSPVRSSRRQRRPRSPL